MAYLFLAWLTAMIKNTPQKGLKGHGLVAGDAASSQLTL